jgi:hypothetical protein
MPHSDTAAASTWWNLTPPGEDRHAPLSARPLPRGEAAAPGRSSGQDIRAKRGFRTEAVLARRPGWARSAPDGAHLLEPNRKGAPAVRLDPLSPFGRQPAPPGREVGARCASRIHQTVMIKLARMAHDLTQINVPLGRNLQLKNSSAHPAMSENAKLTLIARP